MAEALLTTQWVKIINKKKFTKVALNKNIGAFVVYIVFLTSKLLIYLV